MEEKGLLVSKVPRALEMKSKLFGFELPDLLLIFFNLAITNLMFGGTSFRYVMVWGTTLGMALFLYFAKRGRPDNYLQHLGEYIARPAYYAAGRVQKRFLRRMIDCLIYTTEGIKTFYHIDIMEESHNQQKNNKMAGGNTPWPLLF